ncbi:MAG: toll/interleukin-1 receptor domain-containing protein [Promethearchaeota archaeon]
MLFLSISGWYKGITSILIFIFGWAFGIYLVRSSKHQNSQLLRNLGLGAILMANVQFAIVLDFFFCLIRGEHPPFSVPIPPGTNTYLVDVLTGWMWLPPAMLMLALVGADLIMQNYRKSILIGQLVYGIIFMFILFFDSTNNLGTVPSSIPCTELTRRYFITFSPLFIMGWGYFLFLILIVIGFAIRGFQGKGTIRKRFISISIGFLCISLTFLRLEPFIGEIFNRSLLFFGLILMYLGIKPKKPSKTKKKAKPEEVIKLASFMMGTKETVHKEIKNSMKDLLVFISYATRDANLFKIHEIAKELKNLPEIENILYWEEHMEDNIFEYMDENIGKCNIMLLFCSENSLNSKPVKKEWTAAEAIGLPIIPVFYELDHIPTLLKSRLGLEYDFYDMQKNITGLRNLILKKCRDT